MEDIKSTELTTWTHSAPLFEDFHLGEEIAHAGGRTVTEGDNALYIGLTGDRHPLYCDAEFARSLGYTRELINDLLVFHIVFGKTVPDISAGAIANLGYAGVRFLRPVYPGDTLRARSKVVGTKENSSHKNGNVYVCTHGLNQRDETVLEFYRWVMVPKRDPESVCGESSVPDLPSEVMPDQFAIDKELSNTKPGGVEWPSTMRIEEQHTYLKVHHGPGMTIEEAEHATATRLYQNTARVHFDAHFMEKSGRGKRLIYGGHVISLAHAMAYNGLENAARILAWNSGTHANPTFAGDTLYAFTELLDTMNLPGLTDVGAMRLRLVAVKNLDPSTSFIEVKTYDEAKKREMYHPNVVLDLDYVVLMPKI